MTLSITCRSIDKECGVAGVGPSRPQMTYCSVFYVTLLLISGIPEDFLFRELDDQTNSNRKVIFLFREPVHQTNSNYNTIILFRELVDQTNSNYYVIFLFRKLVN